MNDAERTDATEAIEDCWEQIVALRGKTIAQYQRQTIPRTDDMPADAFGWQAFDLEGVRFCEWLLFDEDRDVWWKEAPDLLPDTPGPVYRAIVDVDAQ